MKKIFYWSPFIGKIATIKAVINSATSIKKYEKKDNNVSIINCYGEWDKYRNILKKNKIVITTLQKFFKVNVNTQGYFNSRKIFIFSFFFLYFKLKKLLEDNKPDILIIHLLTYIPLLLFLSNNFDTKLYLRISGKPKLGFLRKIFWKFSSNKIDKVFCPTQETKKILEKMKIFSKQKLIYLPDPVINKKVNLFKKKQLIKNYNFKDKKYYLSIGRLSKQKNHKFLIEFMKKKDSKLIILGNGELRKNLSDYINNNNIKNVKLLGFRRNILDYLKKAKAVIIPSLWEDPGFVMIEAANNIVPIIVSDCPSGPKEFINKNSNGYLFKSNNYKSLSSCFEKFKTDDTKIIKKKILGAFNKSMNYTDLNHYNILKDYLR
jgi:glycosyltransferase involved in cell wall biosynthesis